MKPDQVQALNPILILILILLFDKIIYPLSDKCGIMNKDYEKVSLFYSETRSCPGNEPYSDSDTDSIV